MTNNDCPTPACSGNLILTRTSGPGATAEEIASYPLTFMAPKTWIQVPEELLWDGNDFWGRGSVLFKHIYKCADGIIWNMYAEADSTRRFLLDHPELTVAQARQLERDTGVLYHKHYDEYEFPHHDLRVFARAKAYENFAAKVSE